MDKKVVMAGVWLAILVGCATQAKVDTQTGIGNEQQDINGKLNIIIDQSKKTLQWPTALIAYMVASIVIKMVWDVLCKPVGRKFAQRRAARRPHLTLPKFGDS